MSRVSYFQRFSQRENHTTNNTLLVLRHLYQSSPFKIQRVLTSLIDTDLSIGLNFEQQIKGKHSVPDALISQNPLRIFIETKLGGELDRDQISRHLKSISKSGNSSNDILIGITKEPISDSDAKVLKEEAAACAVRFGTVTFTQIKDALYEQCEKHESELKAIIEDYEQYLAEEKLLEEKNQWLVVFPCGTSLAENIRFDLYYEPASRPCKRNHRFIGIYAQKAVAYIGMVKAIITTSCIDGSIVFATEAGEITAEYQTRITEAIDQTPYYDLKESPTRFYIVDNFLHTDLKKSSPGGLQGFRYLDLSAIIKGFNPRTVYTTEEIAKLLRNNSFS